MPLPADLYADWFKQATGHTPFPYQERFAKADPLPNLLDVPTGLGKTACAVLGWLWRRRFDPRPTIRAGTPRRLVYCLPMRVLVEQTYGEAVRWLDKLGILAGKAEWEGEAEKKRLSSYNPEPENSELPADSWAKQHRCDGAPIAVHLLMGGEEKTDWASWPERDAILIGTQDMLLSRALNRGYAAGRARWPMEFGLLNNNCLWVFDELQLMGSGLATAAQLEAFRALLGSKDGHGCRSIWMSATLRRDWLKTVDFDAAKLAEPARVAKKDDFKSDEVKQRWEERWEAKKPLTKAQANMGDAAGLADEVRRAHQAGTRTIVIVNTVPRACELFEALSKSVDDGKAKGQKRKKRGTQDAVASASTPPRPVLLHSRFRSGDREREVAAALADPPAEGTIVVSTQVIEAGVDVSATTLFTELAPWASLVQRFGRCNRRGEANDRAAVHWVDVPERKEPVEIKLPPGTQVPTIPDDLKEEIECKTGTEKKPAVLKFKKVLTRDLADRAKALFPENKEVANAIDDEEYAEAAKVGLPYELEDIKKSVEQLRKLRDVGLESLPDIKLPFEHSHVIRRKDLVDLFDTTPDLAGNDIDIDRFVRDVEQIDVQVFWRDWGQPNGNEAPSDDEPAPRREELCPAPVGQFRNFIGDKKRIGKVWRWNFLEGEWERVSPGMIVPGHVFLIHANAGGYTSERGWNATDTDRVDPIVFDEPQPALPADATDADEPSRIGVWQTIAHHTEEVCREVEVILDGLGTDGHPAAALRLAARWHDRGKAHEVFQNAVDDGQKVQRKDKIVQRRERPDNWRGCRLIAKAPDRRRDRAGAVIDPGFWQGYERRHFRHELASAVALLDPGNTQVPDDLRDLVAYVVAAHHGKVRLSMRSLPNEKKPCDADGYPAPSRRFARGVWDGDKLPETDVGGGVFAPSVTLSLEPMELGLCEGEPFTGLPSWAERMLRLRDSLGPFRLAYLEAILRAADMRASRAAERRSSSAGKKETVHA